MITFFIGGVNQPINSWIIKKSLAPVEQTTIGLMRGSHDRTPNKSELGEMATRRMLVVVVAAAVAAGAVAVAAVVVALGLFPNTNTAQEKRIHSLGPIHQPTGNLKETVGEVDTG